MSDSSAAAIRRFEAAQGSIGGGGEAGVCVCCSLRLLHEDCHRARGLQEVPDSTRRKRGPSFLYLPAGNSLGVRDSLGQ